MTGGSLLPQLLELRRAVFNHYAKLPPVHANRCTTPVRNSLPPTSRTKNPAMSETSLPHTGHSTSTTRCHGM